MVVAGSPDQGNQVGISLERQALKGKAHSKLDFLLLEIIRARTHSEGFQETDGHLRRRAGLRGWAGLWWRALLGRRRAVWWWRARLIKGSKWASVSNVRHSG